MSILQWSILLIFTRAQKAATRACRNAIEFNSIPSVSRLVPGGYENLRLHVKIGTPHPVGSRTHLHQARHFC